MFLIIRKIYLLLYRTHVNVKRTDKGYSLDFLLLVRTSRASDTVQPRSLKRGMDLVNFSIAFIVYVQHNL